MFKLLGLNTVCSFHLWNKVMKKENISLSTQINKHALELSL